MSEITNVSADDVERIENNYDVLLFRLAGIEAANEEGIPGDVVDRLMHGQPPLAVWRAHRAITREALAAASGVSLAEIASVEAGGPDLNLRKSVAVAKVLRIDAEDLLPWTEAVAAG